jgi:hypothetical protein
MSLHDTPNNSFSLRVDCLHLYTMILWDGLLYPLSMGVSVLFFLKYRFSTVSMLSVLNLWAFRCRFSAGIGCEKDICGSQN